MGSPRGQSKIQVPYALIPHQQDQSGSLDVIAAVSPSIDGIRKALLINMNALLNLDSEKSLSILLPISQIPNPDRSSRSSQSIAPPPPLSLDIPRTGQTMLSLR